MIWKRTNRIHWICDSLGLWNNFPVIHTFVSFKYTAMFIWNRCSACLWREMGTFQSGVMRCKSTRQYLVYSFRPLLRPFKWGTVWHFILRGIKAATILRFKLSTLLNKSRLFGIFKLRLLVVLMPLDVECHTVPHLKALTRGIEHWSAHGQASIFRWQKMSFKSTHFTS